MGQRRLRNPFIITKTIVERFDTLDRGDIGCYGILLPHSPAEPMIYESKPVADKAYAYLKKVWNWMINIGDLVYDNCDTQKTLGLVTKSMHGRWLIHFLNERRVWLFARDITKINER